MTSTVTPAARPPRRRLTRHRTAWAAAVMALALLLSTSAAGATEEPLFVGWSPLLPAEVQEYQPSSELECRSGHPRCVTRTLKQMERRFDPLAEACDHNAVFSLAYLRTTEEYERAAAEPGFFQDPSYVNHEDAVFAEFYFAAYDAWTGDREGDVPAAWRIAFDAARGQKVSGSGNLFLGMNAHVNRDLPLVLAGIGIVAPDGSTRKADHDKVNEMLNRVVVPLLDELATRFDPTIDDSKSPYYITYTGTMQMLVEWRERAWRNAERLAAAADETARAVVVAEIEAEAALNAEALVTAYSYKDPLTSAAARNAHCASVS